jgi:hypothetical protein
MFIWYPKIIYILRKEQKFRLCFKTNKALKHIKLTEYKELQNG